MEGHLQEDRATRRSTAGRPGVTSWQHNPHRLGALLVLSPRQSYLYQNPLEANGVHTANWRVDERDSEQYRVFFVVAPDGLCYDFHQPICRTGD